MTEARRWLEQKRRGLLTRQLAGSLALGLGAVLAALAVGLLLGRLGVYRHASWVIVAAWLLPLAALALGARHVLRRTRSLDVLSLADVIERSRGRRRGWVAGAAAWADVAGSSSLASLADRQVTEWLAREGNGGLASSRRDANRRLTAGVSVLAVGAAAFAIANPVSAGAAFWRPFHVVLSARGPVELEVDRTEVQRGERVSVRVTARGRASASLWVRAPGQAWDQQPLALDSAGTATVVLGPLDSDRFLRAVSGGRSSATVYVEVALPMLVTALELVARYPQYLDRPDELLVAGPDTVLLPVGTQVRVRGSTTVPLARAVWVSDHGEHALATDGVRFRGSFPVRRSGRWELAVETESGGSLSEDPPSLTIVAVPDSAPSVAVPVPGTDTTAPGSLQQALLIDARDDHRLATIEIVSWRVSRVGSRSDPVVERVPLPEGGMERALVHWMLDLNDRGFLPGDTAFFHARVHDNAPSPQAAESPVYRLRLLSMAELRQALREGSEAIGEEADSLVAEQEALARRLDDLAAERERAATAEGDQLPFESAERARGLLEEEEQLAERAEALRDQVQELSEEAWRAGITDPAFHEQLREIQDLLQRAITEELVERLDALRDALEQLDGSDVRDALRQLADAAERLRDELERSRDLFERAAIEGELTTLSSDAEELVREQEAWNEALGAMPDSAAAALERDLAARADSMAAPLDRLREALDSARMSQGDLAQGQAAAASAAGQMDRAATDAEAGQQSSARESGERAAEELDPLAQQLREERDRLREEWRQEVLRELDRALVETVNLARAQQEIGDRLDRGESGPEVRGQQAAVKEGVDRVVERLRSAAGKNALVSPQLGTALGLARLRMEESLEQLQQPTPNTREAGERAGESVDALNQVVYEMVESRDRVSGAESGSGLAEALEQMAQLAEQQGQLNGQAGGLLSMMQAGGEALMQELQALAARQRALAQQLERLRAEGDLSGTGELAEEADDIARDLEGGRLDGEVVERQERLFRRLLDAGRSLESEEEDEERERVAESARPGNVRMPEPGEVASDAPRYPYPTWEELRALSPEERRLIMDYFRRLNRVRP